MIYVIKDILLFLQKLIRNSSTRTPAFQAACSFFETNREVPALSFQNLENFSNSKPRPPGKKFGLKSDPPGSENVRIPRGRPGGWSGLELTDTSITHESDLDMKTTDKIRVKVC